VPEADVQAFQAALRALNGRLGRAPYVSEYTAHRKREAPGLISFQQAFRLFGSWKGALRSVGLVSTPQSIPCEPDKARAALLQAASHYRTTRLSAPMYDRYRASEAPGLPSSSVIRKRLGPWARAVASAGLDETKGRAEPAAERRARMARALEAAWRRGGRCPLTPASYRVILSAVEPSERGDFPLVEEVVGAFSTWDKALLAAGIEEKEWVHRESLWTNLEIKRIDENVTKVFGTPDYTSDQYKALRRGSRRPLPSYHVLCEMRPARPEQCLTALGDESRGDEPTRTGELAVAAA
jgi:hypothetical protein